MKDIPRVKIAHLPTPLEPMPQLSKALGGIHLFIKRDDQTGLAFGGNKTRKLEFLVADALASGARTLVTAGAIQSNHCRQTAAAAARFGLDCVLVLTHEAKLESRPPPNRKHNMTGNLLLDHLFGAEVVWTRHDERNENLRKTFLSVLEMGRKPYLIPYGGSNPIGAAAYVFALRELQEQIKKVSLNGEGFDWIILASSSGGTQAGLVAGKCIFTCQGRIHGISIDEQAIILRPQVAELATQVCELLGETQQINAEEVQVNDNYLGGGYAVLGEPEIEAIRLFARYEGLLLDPVYTGRAAAGMIDLIRRGDISNGDKVLFWHTGGSPALFAKRYQKSLANM